MSEAEPTVDYIEKFAYFPTHLSRGGGWIWLENYWLKLVSYEPSLKETNAFGNHYYVNSRGYYLSNREKEKDEVWEELLRDRK
jgi:hypothetical protein